MGRPTKVQERINKIERANDRIDEAAASKLFDAYKDIEDIAFTKDGTPAATRMSALKYVVERAQNFIDKNTQQEESAPDYSNDITAPIIASSYDEERLN